MENRFEKLRTLRLSTFAIMGTGFGFGLSMPPSNTRAQDVVATAPDKNQSAFGEALVPLDTTAVEDPRLVIQKLFATGEAGEPTTHSVFMAKPSTEDPGTPPTKKSTLSPNTLAVPYGAATLGVADPKLLTQSLIDQMARAAIKPPDVVELFPKNQNWFKKEAGHAVNWIAKKLKKHWFQNQPLPEGQANENSLFGVRTKGYIREATNYALTGPTFSGPCTSVFEQDFQSFRAMAALHETSHFVDAELGTSKKLYGDYVKLHNHPNSIGKDDDLWANIVERVADVSAFLYTKSNFVDSKAAAYFADYRLASLDYIHFSSPSLDAAQEDFARKPTFGMSIVDTVKRAAEIIGAETDIADERELYNYSTIDIMRRQQGSEGAKIKDNNDPNAMDKLYAVEAAIHKARDRLCQVEASPFLDVPARPEAGKPAGIIFEPE